MLPRGSVVSCDVLREAGRLRVRLPMTSFDFSMNAASSNMALNSTQPLTPMSTTKLPEGKVWPARKASKITATCEPNV
jgi:hypothetical protein